MGRGRQKAKHTKVARELKYNVPETNYEQLQRELQGSSPASHEEDELSKWSEYLDDESAEEDAEDYDHRRFA
ncbi:DUF3073 domain-containing protein [Gulosibacter chungangensis]|uniref:DUF3073 domain-containing protein n=1 Tax=Gulosibacter chungangensis TaxID=979746 RepID=A0A7J5BB13_9MICO|nr:DUF3073 domain-containing protein [Gulosibacter chungangensis]KAB1642207.1 DUF3073 domain-containing protein [Gulosibacter chungangensis]